MTTLGSGTAQALAHEPVSAPTDRPAAGAEFAVYRGVKSMLRCDEADVVRSIAAYVISQHRALRLLSRLIERNRDGFIPGVVGLIGWLRAFTSIRSPGRSADCAWIARLNNERRAIEAMRCFAPDLSWIE